MEPTTLQKIIELIEVSLKLDIIEEIKRGACVKRESNDTVEIDGVRVYRNLDNSISVVLRFDSEEIAKLFEPSKDELEKLAEQKRLELEEIENQLKKRTKNGKAIY